MIRFLILSLLSVSAWASTPAPLTYCWDGLPTTTLGTDCPPFVSQAGLQEATGANAARVRAVSDIQFDAAYLKHLPTVGGVCPAKPSYAEMVAAVSVPGAAAGAFSGVVTGLTAAGEYCTYAMAVRRDQPPANTTNPGLYIAVSEPWTFTPPAVGGVVKWNPGHYYKPTKNPPGGGYTTPQSAAQQQPRLTEYASWDADTRNAIRGVTFRTSWGALEYSTPGDETGYAWLDEEIAVLAAMNPPKRFWLRIQTSTEGSTALAACNTTAAQSPNQIATIVFPRYARLNEYVAWSDGTRRKCTVKFWEAPARNAYIAFLQKLGERYDSHPLFEGITLNKETSINPGILQVPGYTASGHVDGLKLVAEAAKQAFPTSNVVLNINSVNGSDAQRDNLLNWSLANGIGIAGPDLAPYCNSPNIAPDCVFQTPQGGSSNVGGVYNFNKANSLGAIPIPYSVEPSQLGNDAVGQPGGYDAPTLVRFCTEWAMGCTHLFWGEQQQKDKLVSQQWNPTGGGGIRDYIRDNPNSLSPNAECPQSHLNRGGCLTGGTP
jgi:hypothetical protein